MRLAAKVEHVVKHGAAGLKGAVTAANGFEGVTGSDGIGHGLYQREYAAAIGFNLNLKASVCPRQPFHQPHLKIPIGFQAGGMGEGALIRHR